MIRTIAAHGRRNVPGYLALFVALAGTSYAATSLPRNSVGSKQIKKNAVRSRHVKNHSLRAIDFRAGDLPSGKRGPKGNRGDRGFRGFQGPPGPFPGNEVGWRARERRANAGWNPAFALRSRATLLRPRTLGTASANQLAD